MVQSSNNNSISATWHASHLSPISARCGHICQVVDRLNDFGTELIVIHGGINEEKEALADLHILHVADQEWLDVEAAAVGPGMRAFHASCTIGSSIYIFAGHVYLQKRLKQFNDIWRLDTETWLWHRLEASPDQPAPQPRDRSSMIALDNHRILIYGGSDALNKKLDDAWIYDVQTSSWSEVIITSGPKPKPRCSSVLFRLGNRIILFGGDVAGASAGPSNDLWSLRGVLPDTIDKNKIGNTDPTSPVPPSPPPPPPQWTFLQLPTTLPADPAPAPRRGHSSAPAEACGGILIAGGLSEQKSILGIKRQTEYLMDLVILQRQATTLAWKHIAVFGSGNNNMQDGIDHRVENQSMVNMVDRPVPREKHTMVALTDGRFFLFGGTDGKTTLGDGWWLTLDNNCKTVEINHHGPEPTTMTHEGTDAATLSDLEKQLGSQQPTTVRSALLQTSQTSNVSYWQLPQGLTSSLQTVVPQLATSALSSLKDRFGYKDGAPTQYSSSIKSSHLTSQLLLDSATAAVHMAAVGEAIKDEDLLRLGRESLGVDSTPDSYVEAARQYFVRMRADSLKLGEVSVLLRDYRRMARIGWKHAMSELGPELFQSEEQTPFILMGRYMHWNAEDVRMKDVAAILDDYRVLITLAAEVANEKMLTMNTE